MRLGNSIDDPGTGHLWQRRFVNGLNILFSRPGWGKTTIATKVAGHVTQGRTWPDGSACEQGMVLYLKGEGSDASLRDRMQNAGAHPDHYIVVSRATGLGEPMIDLANDTPSVVDALDRYPDIRLIVVDTLDSMFPSMKMIDNASIRRCLWPLQQLSEERGICTLILAHTNKGQYNDPLDRLSGGRAIGGAARSVWYLGKLDYDADEHYLAAVKANDFRPAHAIEYQIIARSEDRPGGIRWCGEREDVEAWDLDRFQQKTGTSGKAEECQLWLAELLRNQGPIETAEVAQKAHDQGYGRRVLTTAKSNLGIKSKAAKGTRPPDYYMCLPEQEAPDKTGEGEPTSTQAA
jgi:putative DNA primase/helicase